MIILYRACRRLKHVSVLCVVCAPSLGSPLSFIRIVLGLVLPVFPSIISATPDARQHDVSTDDDWDEDQLT